MDQIGFANEALRLSPLNVADHMPPNRRVVNFITLPRKFFGSVLSHVEQPVGKRRIYGFDRVSLGHRNQCNLVRAAAAALGRL
jgi:hypothetical protein